MKKTQMIVAQGLIVQRGRVLIGLRVSTKPLDAHGLWQCPADQVEFGETPEVAMIREVKEETGFRVKATVTTPFVANVLWKHKTYQVQVILLTYPCRIVGGKLTGNERENSDWKWIARRDFRKFKFTPGSDQALRCWFAQSG